MRHFCCTGALGHVTYLVSKCKYVAECMHAESAVGAGVAVLLQPFMCVGEFTGEITEVCGSDSVYSEHIVRWMFCHCKTKNR